jgi:hypothetical protein
VDDFVDPTPWNADRDSQLVLRDAGVLQVFLHEHLTGMGRRHDRVAVQGRSSVISGS